jgi:hypothetical protein
MLITRHKHTCLVFHRTYFCAECYEHDSSEVVPENVQISLRDSAALVHVTSNIDLVLLLLLDIVK